MFAPVSAHRSVLPMLRFVVAGLIVRQVNAPGSECARVDVIGQGANVGKTFVRTRIALELLKFDTI